MYVSDVHYIHSVLHTSAMKYENNTKFNKIHE